MTTKLEIFNEAAEALTVLDVARALDIGLEMGLQCSPFREDRNPSFEVRHDGHAFVDYATGDKGGSVKFLMLARPDWSKEERVGWLVELAGRAADYAGAKGPSKAKLAEARRQRRVKAFETANKAWSIQGHKDPTPKWSDELNSNYVMGSVFIEDHPEVASKIAKRRGWPTSWVQVMAEVGKLGYVEERWKPWRRNVAFVVERPGLKQGMALTPCGYHQVYYDFKTEEKSWMFHPYRKRDGVSCKPYPFVLGDLECPGLVVIHEGQWDAASWWGAAGYFDDAPLGDAICCFGLRGAKSIEVFLAVYGDWLRWHAPKVWLWNDNDKAGEGFYKNTVDPKTGQALPSLTDRLYRLGVPRVVNTQFDHPELKDFNDAYRASPQSWGPNQIYELMDHEGLT